MAIAAPPRAAKGTEQATPLQLGYTMPGDFLLQILVTSEAADIPVPSFGTDPACAMPPSARHQPVPCAMPESASRWLIDRISACRRVREARGLLDGVARLGLPVARRRQTRAGAICQHREGNIRVRAAHHVRQRRPGATNIYSDCNKSCIDCLSLLLELR